MKKISSSLIPAALIVSGILAGCSKDNPDPDFATDPTYGAEPTLSWAANPDFSDTYLASEMDVELVVTAEEGIATFVVDVDSETLSPMLSLLGINNPMDLINDEAAIAMLSELGVQVGDQLLGQTSVNFSLSNLIPLIYQLGPDPGTKHRFTLEVTDWAGRTLEQTLTFIMPEKPSTAPTLRWDANPTFEDTYLAETMNVELVVTAPASIATFEVEIDSPTLNFMLPILGLSTNLDLIYGDDNALSTLSGLGLPVGDDLFAKTEVNFSLSTLVPLIYALGPDSGSQHKFTLKVSDFAGYSLEQTLTFIMP